MLEFLFPAGSNQIILKTGIIAFWLCDDRTDLVLHDDVGLNPETEGRRRINVLSLFGRALYGLSAVALTSDRSSSTLAIGWNSLYTLIPYLCFT